MNIRTSLLVFAIVLMTGCSDDITMVEVDNSVYLMTIESGVGYTDGVVYTTFGTLPKMDLDDPWLGLEWLPPEQGNQSSARAMVLNPGELVAIGLVNTRSDWISPQGGTYQYFSDWGAVAVAGDGVTYSDATKVSLYINTYTQDDYTYVSKMTLGDEVVGGAIAYKKTFPNDGLVRQIYSRQVGIFGCHGDGGLLLRSSGGLATAVTGQFSYVSPRAQVSDVTVNCTRYESVVAAQRAIVDMQIQP